MIPVLWRRYMYHKSIFLYSDETMLAKQGKYFQQVSNLADFVYIVHPTSCVTIYTALSLCIAPACHLLTILKLGIRMRIMCLTRSTWKVRNGKARSTVEMTPCWPLPNLLHRSASEVNCSSADAQVGLSPLSCRLSSLCWAVNRLHTCTSGLVLVSSSILWVLNLDRHRDGIMSST